MRCQQKTPRTVYLPSTISTPVHLWTAKTSRVFINGPIIDRQPHTSIHPRDCRVWSLQIAFFLLGLHPPIKGTNGGIAERFKRARVWWLGCVNIIMVVAREVVDELWFWI